MPRPPERGFLNPLDYTVQTVYSMIVYESQTSDERA